MDVLDRNSPVPLYFQLKQILIGKIESGSWKPGELILSELEIKDLFDLSRTTIRQTLGEMVKEGYLTRYRGRGTFVSESKPKTKLMHNPADPQELNRYMSQQGLHPGWELVRRGWLDDIPAFVQNQLMLEPGSRVHHIVRLRLADTQPIGYHQAWLPGNIANRLDETQLTHGKSTSYLQHLPEMKHARFNRSIEALLATTEDAAMLEVKPGSPILQIQRTVMVEQRPIEFLQARYRGDQFRYHITSSD